MTSVRDLELIEKARNGDKAAFEEIFNAYSGQVLNFLYRYMGDYQKAEDVMVEAFLDVYRRLPSYKEQGSFLSWVYTIALNYARSSFRRLWRREIPSSGSLGDNPTPLDTAQAPDATRPDNIARMNEAEKTVQSCLKKLNEKYRIVIVACDIEGLPYEEAARVLGLSKGVVATRLHRARAIFWELLKKEGLDIER